MAEEVGVFIAQECYSHHLQNMTTPLVGHKGVIPDIVVQKVGIRILIENHLYLAPVFISRTLGRWAFRFLPEVFAKAQSMISFWAKVLPKQ